jgi:hypothetical protein
MFSLFPELIVLGDFDDSNAKHALFEEREDEIAGKRLALNIRRLPHWVLSRAQHVSRWGVYPDYEPIPMESAEQLAESDFPESRLALYTGHGRFEIDRWLRMEHLVQDFLGFISEFTDVDEERHAAVLSAPTVNSHDYDHEVANWFTPSQVERMYAGNPTWAALERKLYGHLYETAPERHS